MKRFVITVLGVTVFCIGLGAIVDTASAKFKSDERALALIKQARLAIGGDQSIAEIRSMIIKGNTTLTFKVDGSNRTEQGETEIAMQLPDKMSKMIKIGHDDGVAGSEKIVNKQHDVMILRRGGEPQGEGVGQAGRKVVIEKVEGAGDPQTVVATRKNGEWKTEDGKTVTLVRKGDGPVVDQEIVVRDKGENAMFERHRDNEMLRTTLALLLTAPEGIEVNYTFGGEGDVDGTPCNIVNAEAVGSSFKLYLSKASSLPVMISYQGHAMPKVMVFKAKAPEAGVPADDKIVTFNHKVEVPDMAEIQVRFSDFRGVNGVQLPYKWTTTVAGQPGEVLDVTSYEINPANIADKFKNEKVMWRRTKDTQ